MTMGPFEIWRRGFRSGAKTNQAAAQAPSDIATEIVALRQRLAALEANMPGKTAAPRLRQRVTLTALVLAGAALAGASIVSGQSAVESLFISQSGNVGIGTNNPASRLTVVGNASIGTEAPAPQNGLLVQGDVGIGGAPRAGVKLDVAGPINATAVNVDGTPILAEVQKTLSQQAGAITTLTQRNVIRGCAVRHSNYVEFQQCKLGEIAVAGGGRCDNLHRIVESHPVDRNGVGSSDGARPSGWKLWCQINGENPNYAPPSDIYAICCPVE
jgi:hypothetical protein